MTYIFQSVRREGDVGNYATIRNYEIRTEDEKIAEKIRKNIFFGSDLFEITPSVLLADPVKAEEAKKRGRPPKVKIVQGMRDSTVTEGVHK